MSTLVMPLNALQTDDLAFLAFPAKSAAQQVSGTTEDLFQNISTIISGILSDVISARTAAQYCATREQCLHTYTQVMMGLGQLIRATVPDKVIDRLTYESLSEMEAEFREYGVGAFGTEMTDQALFTVWSLRKIFDLVMANLCTNANLNPELVKTDMEMAQDFSTHVLYGRFHLDCLTMSLRSSKPIYPEVLDCISEGLRNVVNAYATARQACDLRHPRQEEELVMIEFDDEEQELLHSSMKDVFLEA
jgi:hypothetical protein